MSHRRSRHEKVIDQTRWDGSTLTFNAQGAGTSALVMVTDGTQETILRIRGQIISYADGAQAPAGHVVMALGALVVQASSSTTVIQSPLTDADAPWLFYETWNIGYEEMVTDVIDVPGITSFRKTIDSKAMRILREGREVQLVLEQISLGGAMNTNTSLAFRMLLGVK